MQKDSPRNSLTTTPRPYEIDKEGNFNWTFDLDDSSPIESDFLQTLNIERRLITEQFQWYSAFSIENNDLNTFISRSFVNDVDSTTSSVSEDITLLTTQVLQNCKSEIEKCDKKLQKKVIIRFKVLLDRG